MNKNELQVIANKGDSVSVLAHYLLVTHGSHAPEHNRVSPKDRLLQIRLALQQALEALDRIEEQQEAESDNC